MVDFVHIWNADILAGDWLLEAPGIADDADLRTSVIISLFTDRLAQPDDALPDDTTNRRGWWADTETDLIGSRLWLLSREKRIEPVRQRAIDYSREALQWLIDDGVARAVDVDAEWSGLDRLDILVTVYRNDGRSIEMRLEWVWNQLTGAPTTATP